MVGAGIDLRTGGDACHLALGLLLLCLQEGDVIVLIDGSLAVGDMHMQYAGFLCVVVFPAQGIDLGDTDGEIPLHASFYLAAFHLDGIVAAWRQQRVGCLGQNVLVEVRPHR